MLSLLSWIGQRGTTAVAASVFIGVSLPALSAVIRPYLTLLVFLLLILAFLRFDPAAAAKHLKRPFLLVCASLWIMVVLPLLALAAAHALGLPALGDDVMLAVFIAMAPPAIMSAPAFIYLMGLNGAFSLTVLVACVVVTPLSAPFLAELMAGADLPLDPWMLAFQLGWLLIGSFAIASVLRRVTGKDRIRGYSSQIDGLNVILLLFFAIAAMDSVAANFLDRPVFSVLITLFTYLVAFLQLGLTMLVFSFLPRADAFAIAHSAATRNLGLLVAAFHGSLPEFTWLWFALAQFPTFTLPLLLKPLVRRFIAPAEETKT
ncbi:sodium:proton symporter [Roseibium sp. RKSG952]|nr:sodium:proton symporter [Roseibium sp. RKSG952]